MRIVTLQEYCKLERAGIEWIIPGILPRPSWILLLGEAKVGKSTFALQLASAISRGQPFFPHTSTKPGRVLFLQFDTSEVVWRARILDSEKAGLDMTGPLLTVHPDDELRPINILETKAQNWLKEVIALSVPTVVVIDVLREIHSAEENDSSSMKIMGDILYSLTKHCTTILLHHSKKTDPEKHVDPIAASRGSTYITGKSDSIWLLHGNSLYTVPRFAERRCYTMNKSDIGLWSFC